VHIIAAIFLACALLVNLYFIYTGIHSAKILQNWKLPILYEHHIAAIFLA